MSDFETLRDYNRFTPNFKKSLVREVLPEYFQTSYPNLISFLEGYYEHLDSDENFGGMTNELLTIRDVEDTSLSRINFLLNEVALGVGQSQFIFPREALKNFGNFFRVKGSLYSAEGFFRAFFNENQVEITYPKDRLMRVGNTPIGPEEDFLLQDGRIFQIFSVLIKSPLSLSDWEILYRNFVHPAGFFLGAEVTLVAEGEVVVGTAESIFDPNSNKTIIITDAAFAMLGQHEPSHYYTMTPGISPGATYGRMHPLRTIKFFDSIGQNNMQFLATMYSDIEELGGYTQTFDDSDSAGSAIRFDNTFDTFDQRQYQHKT